MKNTKVKSKNSLQLRRFFRHFLKFLKMFDFVMMKNRLKIPKNSQLRQKSDGAVKKVTELKPLFFKALRAISVAFFKKCQVNLENEIHF